MSYKIKYIISSHKNYFRITTEKLILSLLNSGINREDICLVVGGIGPLQCLNLTFSDYFSEGLPDPPIETVVSGDNSFDLTALIEVVKNNLFKDYDYIFLLHDTCSVRLEFKEKVESYINENTVTIGLWSDHQSSNIGLYKRSYLTEIKNEILALENKTKTDYVHTEDKFLRHTPYEKQFFGTKPNITGYEKIYNDETVREVNICEEIGLIKYKANWQVQEWINKP